MKRRAKKYERANGLVKSERVDQIAALLVVGTPRRDILEWARKETDWHAHERTIDRYIRHAFAALAALAAPRRAEMLGRAIARREALFLRCMKVQDYKTALAVDKDLCDLLGLYPDSGTAAAAGGTEAPRNVTVNVLMQQDPDTMRTTLQRLMDRGLLTREEPHGPTVDAARVP